MHEAGFGKLPQELKENSLSPSKIVKLLESPKHYYSAYHKEEFKQTDAMLDGILFHKFILEPDEFEKDYALPIDPELIKGTMKTSDDLKAKCKELGLKVSGKKDDLIKRIMDQDASVKFYDEVMAKYLNGRIEVTESKLENLNRIKEEIKEHKYGNALINGEGDTEFFMHYFHPEAEVWINMKADKHVKLKTGKNVIVDLKRTPKLGLKKFQANLYDMNWHVLASLYVDAFKAITGEDAMFAWVGVEPKPPYVVATYAADFGCLEAGRTQAFHAIESWKEAKKTGKWVGPGGDDLVNATLPTWAWAEIESD